MLWTASIFGLAGAAFYVFVRSKQSGSASRLGSGVMFDGIATIYDSANMVMSLGLHHMWKDVLVARMDIQPGDRVVDLATGTGDIAIKLADIMTTEHPSVKREGQEAASPPASMTGSVLGLDPSRKMLDIARDKIMSRRLTGVITLMQGDAEVLSDIPDGTYDKLTISFGIRNMASRVNAMKEARRIMKSDNPGGRIGILEFVSPTEGPLSTAAAIFLNYCIPVIGAVMSLGTAVGEYTHLRDSIKEFPSPAQFLDMMTDAGFSGCKTENVFLNTVYLWTCDSYVHDQSTPITTSSRNGDEEDGDEEEGEDALAGAREL